MSKTILKDQRYPAGERVLLIFRGIARETRPGFLSRIESEEVEMKRLQISLMTILLPLGFILMGTISPNGAGAYYVAPIVAKGSPSCVAPPSDMVSWWPGDGNAYDIQDGNNGTLINGTTFAAGKVGQGFSFDGVDDVMTIPASTNLGMTSAYTFDAWVNSIGSADLDRLIAARGDASAHDLDIKINRPLSGNTLQISHNRTNDGTPGAVVFAAPPLDQLFHLAVTFNESTVRAYYNGVEAVLVSATNTIAAPLYTNRGWLFGRTDHPAYGGLGRFVGILDEIEIYSRALSASEIQAIVNAGSAGKCRTCTPSPSGLRSWWPGDGSASDINSSRNGIPEGSVTFARGTIGQAFQFNGSQSDGVNLGDVADFDFTPTSSFTIEAWINISALAIAPDDGQVIVALNYKCSNTTQVLAIQNTGKAFFQVRDVNGFGGLAISPSDVSLNTWHHIAGVREVTGSGKTVKLFIDGVLAASTVDMSTGSLVNNGPDYIGRRFPCAVNDPFNGLIDEVSIYDRALTDAEIQSIVNAGSAGKCNCSDITCPANIMRSNDPNRCGAVVSYLPPRGTGCGIFSCSPRSGSFCPVGTTTVTCTSTEGPSCSFRITVDDTQPPAITCPPNQAKNADPNQCGTVVNYAPAISDNCPGVTAFCSPASGSFFPVGTTFVTCRAVDAWGNTAQCATSVTVLDKTPPTVSCPSNLTVIADASCRAATPNIIPSVVASDNCTPANLLRITQLAPAGFMVDGLGPHDIGVTVLDSSGNPGFCTATFTAIDRTPPSVTCPVGTTITVDSGGVAAIPDITTGVIASDCNSSAPLVIAQFPAAATTVGAGQHTITVTATDAAGNSASCTTTFTVVERVGCETAGFRRIEFHPDPTVGPFIGIATGDFNLDGKPDLVAADLSGVMMLLGKGDGAFGPAARVSLEPAPSIVVADFNLDGKPDIATASQQARVSIRLGNGNGGFQPAANFFLSGHGVLSSIVAADFNLDGKPDLAVASEDASIFILLGNGRGGFTDPIRVVSMPVISPVLLAVGDFNLDARPDIAIAGRFWNAVILGDGTGGFGPPHLFEGTEVPGEIVVADINLDGRPDIAIAGFFGTLSQRFMVALGDGMGNFQLGGNDLAGERVVAIADFNLDGIPDFATAAPLGSALEIILGNSPFSFRPQVISHDLPHTMAIGDFNVDGRPDLAVVSARHSDSELFLSVLLNNCAARAPFVCVQDESNGNILHFNTGTGDYEITSCHRLSVSGKGRVTTRGCGITLTDMRPDRAVQVQVDTCRKTGTASFRIFPLKVVARILDRNIMNNTCICR
jgi:hypothetical protein